MTLLQLGDLDQAAQSGEECEALARQLGDPGLLARALVARATQFGSAGNWVDSERYGREAELTARQAQLPRQVALALGQVGTARRELGDLAGSGEAHAAELVAADQTGDDHAIAIAHTNLGSVAIADNRFDTALQHYAEAERTFRRLDVPGSLLPLLANRGQIHQMAGRPAEAVADFADAATAAHRSGSPAAVRQWADTGIQLAYQIGDTARAERLWGMIADASRALGDDPALQRALGDHALLLINRAQPPGVAGDHSNVDQPLIAEAATMLDEQERICRRIDDPVGLAACVGNRAITLRYQGDLPGSLGCLDEQLDVATRSGNAQGVLMATANRGEVLGLLGRTQEALDALGQARATAAQYGLAPMVDQLDAMIAALRASS